MWSALQAHTPRVRSMAGNNKGVCRCKHLHGRECMGPVLHGCTRLSSRVGAQSVYWARSLSQCHSLATASAHPLRTMTYAPPGTHNRTLGRAPLSRDCERAATATAWPVQGSQGAASRPLLCPFRRVPLSARALSVPMPRVPCLWKPAVDLRVHLAGHMSASREPHVSIGC